MKGIIKTIMLSLVLVMAYSCEDDKYAYPCLDGECNTNYIIDTIVSPGAYIDPNGYWRVPHSGLNYFTIAGKLDELDPQYVVNGVPLIYSQYDSDYWILFDTIQWTNSTYGIFGEFSDQDLSNPISIGNVTYTLADIADLHPPFNIVGYQIPKYFCFDCPYAPTIVSTYVKYTYRPRQQIFYDSEMAGPDTQDTANITIKTVYNADTGSRVEIIDTMVVIFE